MSLELIIPGWPSPENVRAYTTTRRGGHSTGPFSSLNLGASLDEPTRVAANRRLLARHLALPAQPHWLTQAHGVRVVDAAAPDDAASADASVAFAAGVVCAVLTADCIPVVICDRRGTRIGCAHAGWRGLAAGVLEALVDRLRAPPAQLLVWLGPGIGADVYEVGDEVRAAFVDGDPEARRCFRPSPAGRWLADLYGLARRRLRRRGVDAVHGGDLCTWSDPERFFSFRRDGTTGHMATVAWLDAYPA